MSIHEVAIKVVGIDYLRISILSIFVAIACFSSYSQVVHATPPIKKPNTSSTKPPKLPIVKTRPKVFIKGHKNRVAKSSKMPKRPSPNFSKRNKMPSIKWKKRRMKGIIYPTKEMPKILTDNSLFNDSNSINFGPYPWFIVDSTLLKELSPRNVPYRHINFNSITDSLRIKQGVIL